MKIMDILVRDAVVLDLCSQTKGDVLKEMAHALARAEPRLEAGRLLEVLLERESLQSTGIGEGVAIPHGKLPGLDRLIASFAPSAGGPPPAGAPHGPAHAPSPSARRPWSGSRGRARPRPEPGCP